MLPIARPSHYINFQRNQLITFAVILLTDTRTNTETEPKTQPPFVL